MQVRHSLIENEFRTEFIVLFGLLQTGEKNHMINVLLIIQMFVLNLNYLKPVKIFFSDLAVNKEKVVPLWRRKLLRSRKNTSLEEQSIIIVIEKV